VKKNKEFTRYLLLLSIPIMGITVFFNIMFVDISSFSIGYFNSVERLNLQMRQNTKIYEKVISLGEVNSEVELNKKYNDLKTLIKFKVKEKISSELEKLQIELLNELNQFHKIQELMNSREITSTKFSILHNIHTHRLKGLTLQIQNLILGRVSSLSIRGKKRIQSLKNTNTLVSSLSVFGIIIVVIAFMNMNEQILMREYLTSVINKISDALVIVDDDNKIIKMNDKAKVIFGNQLIGENVLKIIKGFSKNKVNVELETTYIDENKSKIPLLYTINNYQVNYKTIHHVVLAKDMRVQNKLKGDLFSAEKLASVGELAAGVAHELNTPLGSIYLVLSQIKEAFKEYKIEDVDLLEMVDDSFDSAKKMGKIISGLQLVSRRPSEQKSLVVIDSIIESVLSICESNFLNNRIELEVKLPKVPVEILCNPAQIGQVLVNLLNNSKDAVELIEHKKIVIEVSEYNEEVIILVKDNGPGISEENLLNMYEPFFTTKQVGKGTGLGLSINKGIVESHKGKLVYLRDNEMTVFKITIPIIQIDEIDLGEAV